MQRVTTHPDAQTLDHTTVPGFLVQAVLAALDDPASIPAGLHAQRRLSSDPGALAMQRSEFCSLLERLVEQAGDPLLALRLGRRTSDSNLHLLGPLITASRSLREAISDLESWQTSTIGFSPWRLVVSGSEARYVRIAHDDDGAAAQLALTMIFSALQRFVGAKHEASIGALFSIPEPLDASEYQTIFSGRVRFGASELGVFFPAVLLDLPRPGTDSTLATMLRELAIERYAQRAPTESWVARLEGALRERSDLSSVDIAQLAKRWQMSPRTLRQQLHAEGTSVTAVLNRIRFERARDLLQRGHSSISAVATMMGYSDPSAFHRAFKRWSGLAVKEFRARAVTDSE